MGRRANFSLSSVPGWSRETADALLDGVSNPTKIPEMKWSSFSILNLMTSKVGINFGVPGKWVKLADIDRVNDLPPFGTGMADDPATITTDGYFEDFVLPSSSGVCI